MAQNNEFQQQAHSLQNFQNMSMFPINYNPNYNLNNIGMINNIQNINTINNPINANGTHINQINTMANENNQDVTKNGVCKKFLHGKCPKTADTCQYSHDASRVRPCQHFINNQCIKGDDCHFSHQIDQDKMPLCRFLKNYGQCTKQGCNYKHILKPCRDYDKGFCQKGNQCQLSHIPRKVCMNYMLGFCPLGPYCDDSHPKLFNKMDKIFLKQYYKYMNVIQCHKCKEIGHKSNDCYATKEYPLSHVIYCFQCQKKHPSDVCPIRQEKN